jgi:hypothetical protein
MDSIAFIDTEVSLKNQEILDIGGVKDNGSSFHSRSTSDFISFIIGSRFLCGHNILNHDLKYLQKAITFFSRIFQETIIQLVEQGYHLKNVKVSFIIFWKDPEKENEFKVILPELNIER